MMNSKVKTGGWAWLCLLMLCHPVVSHSVMILEYETLLTGEPEAVRPASVTLDLHSGGICITDEASRVIDIFDDRGFHLYRTDATSNISTPKDGSIDSHGGFVFTDIAADGTRTIERLNYLGEPVAYEPEIPRAGWAPQHLIIAGDGHYITVDRAGLLAKHDSQSGSLIWMLELVDPQSENADMLGRPSEAPDHRLYIPGSKIRTIFVVSPDGKLLDFFGRRGTQRGEFTFPIGVAFDPVGRVLVLDRMRHKILLFTSAHEFVDEFGRMGDGPGYLYHPLAIASSPDGRVFVAQGFEGRVQIFRLSDTASAPSASNLSRPSAEREKTPAGER
ncbi:MAG: NHL repeat-containing protein [Candidatus Eisenbacteria bacterium]|uniref:NHL repeat-containing protein n=1 Tax=Eiseniibacteriota bacterium TaxID=2212470 RepID=A0A948RX06_UNCEI|nr:NHL repeat-containing protein [Candidatus Eisenbacteria bacterium]MBU1949011.1 NHL repeat-containing protein [Candidatus Eisenbacteria bacterium]MBU2691516.1 NHL repeat-containing protein [Candidatus Eisenbacteria bacterium]